MQFKKYFGFLILFTFTLLLTTGSLFAQMNWKSKMPGTRFKTSESLSPDYLHSKARMNAGKINAKQNELLSPDEIYLLPDTVISYTPFDTSRFLFSYSSSGKLVTRLEEKLSQGKWENSYLLSNTYNSSNFTTVELEQEWDGNNWVNAYKSTNTFDSNGNILTVIFTDWEGNSWINSFKDTYSYNTEGKLLRIISENWEGGSWVKYFRDTFSYNTNGWSIVRFSENYFNNIWVSDFRASYNYDQNDNLLAYLSEFFQDGNWINSSRASLNYDANGFKISELFESWENAAWVLKTRYNYTNDGSGNVIDFNAEKWDETEWVDSYGICVFIDKAQNFHFFIGTNFIFVYRAVNVVVAVSEDEFPKIDATFRLEQNYPNPFNPTTKISFATQETGLVELKIFDMLGREVKAPVNEVKPAGNHEVYFDAGDLGSGVYLYRLTSGNKSQMKKMILVK